MSFSFGGAAKALAYWRRSGGGGVLFDLRGRRGTRVAQSENRASNVSTSLVKLSSRNSLEHRIVERSAVCSALHLRGSIGSRCGERGGLGGLSGTSTTKLGDGRSRRLVVAAEVVCEGGENAVAVSVERRA